MTQDPTVTSNPNSLGKILSTEHGYPTQGSPHRHTLLSMYVCPAPTPASPKGMWNQAGLDSSFLSRIPSVCAWVRKKSWKHCCTGILSPGSC